MSEALLEVAKLRHAYGRFLAVDDFACSQIAGEILGLVGPNGAGKTTVLNLLSGFLKPLTGSAHLNGQDLFQLSPVQRSRKGLGRTFQEPRTVPDLLVREHVQLTLARKHERSPVYRTIFRKSTAQEEAKDTERALEILGQCGLAEVAEEVPETLSFGQKKLLNLAATFASENVVFLLDEPTSGLSTEMKSLVREMIVRKAEAGCSFLIVEHNLKWLSTVSDRIIFMREGRIEGVGEPAEILESQEFIDGYFG